jgi:hypothetical protein
MKWVLVDGYSLVHAWPKLQRLAGRKLEQRRDALLRILRQYADHQRCRLTVVFDGYAAKRKPEASEPAAGIEVVFSATGKTADDVIERLVGEAEQRERIRVVSSDKMVRQTCEALGADSVSAEVFEAEVEGALKDLATLVREHSRRRRIGSMRERFGG